MYFTYNGIIKFFDIIAYKKHDFLVIFQVLKKYWDYQIVLSVIR